MRAPAAVLVALLGLLAWSGTARADDHTFNQPRWFDDRLDFCLNWSADCGKPAADNFCKRHQYTGAGAFEAAPGIGHTRVSGNNQVCDGSFCTGFKYITCTGQIPYEQVFANPVWNEYRLDACLTWGKDCGKPAADAFCRQQGYTSSIHSVLDPERGRSQTRLIGSDEICKENFCVGFQMITCQ